MQPKLTFPGTPWYSDVFWASLAREMSGEASACSSAGCVDPAGEQRPCSPKVSVGKSAPDPWGALLTCWERGSEGAEGLQQPHPHVTPATGPFSQSHPTCLVFIINRVQTARPQPNKTTCPVFRLLLWQAFSKDEGATGRSPNNAV